MKTAYPISSVPVSITLYANIPFDNTYKHHTMISKLFKKNNVNVYTENTIACERFINRVNSSGQFVYPRWNLQSDVYNFDYKNGLLASVVLELTPQQTNANYMKVVSGSDIYYYFITNINQSNVDTYTLSLELDVLMTYQDEFLTGIKDYPVFTIRKHSHRYTQDGLMPYCADYKSNDDAFVNIKPSLITDVINLHYRASSMKTIEDVVWLYICCDMTDVTDFPNIEGLYKAHGKTYPLTMVALPINVESVTYQRYDGTRSVTFTNDEIKEGVKRLIGNGNCHGAKVSPFPPFSINTGGYISFTDGNLVIGSSSIDIILESSLLNLYRMKISNNELYYGKTTFATTLTNALGLVLQCGGVIVSSQNATTYNYDNVASSDLGFVNATAPNINSARYPEPKLLFSPFKKYVLNAPYSSGGCEFFPELIFSNYTTNVSQGLIIPSTNASAYIGDNNFYTKIVGTSPAFANYEFEKIGLASNVNYIFPCGTNALDVFNATQANSFYQSKVANGITSGITAVSGVASIVLGTTMLSNSATAVAGAGMIIGGSTAVAGGLASEVNNIKSTNAKIEDLKNTPDSINISGSNFITDESITATRLPYIVIYDVPKIIKESATDYFYNYGYQVSRECYFNTELSFDNSANGAIDNNLFGRTIFNYIQTNEDITNKINANIPHIVKQKLSSIFNAGITIWNFFGNTSLWGSGSVTTTNNPDKWFMKCELDNTEF